MSISGTRSFKDSAVLIRVIVALLLFVGSAHAQLAALHAGKNPGGGGTPTILHVQSAFLQTGSGTTTTATFGAGVTSGNTVVGQVGFTPVTLTVAVTAGSNTCTNVDNIASNTSYAIVSFYCSNVTGAPTVFTATFTGGSASFPAIMMDEFSGVLTVSPLDGHNGNFNAPATSTAVTSNSFTPGTNGDLIYGMVTQIGGGGDTYTAGSGFTLLQNPGGFASEWQQQTTAASIAATFTGSVADTWAAAGFALKP